LGIIDLLPCTKASGFLQGFALALALVMNIGPLFKEGDTTGKVLSVRN
jgi:hypothetical protein